jgi:hypothetical protein
MKTIFSYLLMMLAITWLGGLLTACAGSGTNCGAGTTEQNGVCVPDISECAPGTVLQGDQCVPQCGNAEYWDSQLSQCVDVPECATGTSFNPVSGLCEPNEDACAEGTHLENGVCVSDSSGCGEGTHLEDGECVPDTLPDPDVPESTDPENPATFNLPDPDQSISLGGTVDTPVDLNDDGYLDADWDVFAVNATAGTYLRIWATSEGAALPAFMVLSSDTDIDGYPLYARYAINPNSVETVREFYLPRDDIYLVYLTDYNHMLSYVFGTPQFPVGGDDFTYYATVENLGTPVISDVSVYPLADSGEMSEGKLFFYNLTGLTAKDIVSLKSAGTPVVDTPSDVLPLISLFDAAGEPFLEVNGNNPAADAEIIFSVPVDGSYLLIQDFLVVVGPDRKYALSAVNEDVTDCTAGGCDPGALAEGEHEVLRWDLTAGDFFLFNFTVPSDATENLGVDFFDAEMNVISGGSAGPTWNRWSKMYTPEDTWVYLWLRGWSDGAVPVYTFEEVHHATGLLEAGTSLDNIPVIDMPEDTLADSGISHFVASPGQLAVFSGFSPSSAWSEPLEAIYSLLITKIGPAIDTTGAELIALDPPLAYMAEAGHYLHMASDAADGSDIVGDTYRATLNFVDTLDLGTPTAGTPVNEVDQTLDADTGLAVFSYTTVDDQLIDITVTPAAATAIQPEIWVMSFGFQSGANWYFNATQPILGLKSVATAAGAGDAISTGTQADYAGMHIVIVKDAGAGDIADTFDIEIADGA